MSVWADARIWQAVIAGAFLGVGWFVNGWQNRRAAADQRAERLRDVHRALYAEIGATLANLESEAALETHRAGIVARMQADPEFIPFVPREHGDRVFASVVENIHVLPRVTIDPIVAFYTQLASIAALADDMRGLRYPTLEPARRAAIYHDYIEMKKQAFAFGLHALALIATYARDGKTAAEAQAAAGRAVSIPASDRSAP